MNAAEFHSFQFQSETLYFGSTQKIRFILMFIIAKLRQSLGVVLRRHRQYCREWSNRAVEILHLYKNFSFIQMHLKLVNACLETFAYTNSLKHISFFQSILAH